ncbi:MAG: DUF6588 family protein [Cyclobacteriaceae bacterium]
MNKIYKVVSLVFIAAVCALPKHVYGQNEQDISIFLSAGEEDAAKLIQAYVEPAVKSISYGMAGGWYNTAKPHKSLGFDIGVTMNLAFIPTSEDYFDPNKLDLSVTNYNGNIDKPGKGAPTFFGPKDETQYVSDPDGVAGPIAPITFSGPEGLAVKQKIGFAAMPVPMIQLGVGVIKNTDIKIRYVNSGMVGAIIPNVDIESSKFNVFGVGVLHDFKQHIKGIKLLPFDLSALIAYNSVSGTSDLSNSDPLKGPTTDDGELDYQFNSWVFQAIISKKISVVTPYAAVGYSMINTNVDMNGNYTVEAGATDLELTDPVAIDFKNNSMILTLGMRLKFGPFYLNGDYTIQKFNTLSVGLGFSVR